MKLWRKFRSWPTWVQVVVWVALALFVLGIATSGGSNDKKVSGTTTVTQTQTQTPATTTSPPVATTDSDVALANAFVAAHFKLAKPVCVTSQNAIGAGISPTLAYKIGFKGFTKGYTSLTPSPIHMWAAVWQACIAHGYNLQGAIS